jgi:recombinational DNA repair ATPase RecF
VLLLDDVLSELDRARGQYLLQAVGAARQVIITTTDLAQFPQEFSERAVLWRVRQGEITEG